ncbi:pyridoxal-phosphate dependent enzyme [Microvirga tunisiensis]|uniref:Pyridoxal-phosphate dependent enzyme n=2 Tax=Pannonibacter tanglangensis TaxID=2750084 RepID=A0ABW9ZT63_9HYPH|nr:MULTISPECIES: threonine/serine dehydratase [unclassified Pannonibacter]NBN65895.1 pyridoxal-phosphate dependent enzyme [Pannonibacter sp. XCT-34]NBN80413.1 pyridoxal-phosphate dependent enzyme [Pannonibacter sp. XCT-53]
MPITAAAIETAYDRITPHIRVTPLLQLRRGDFGLPFAASLKLESLQHSGSFKARGAFNALLSQEVPLVGVTAASGGNHGAAVAYAARALGIPARIFVPEISTPAKIARIRAYGADVSVVGKTYAEARRACEAWRDETGALDIHAYDAEPTIVGQGTLALEWEGQARGLDTLFIAVGGGGLISGIATWFAGKTRIIGVEPVSCPSLSAALSAGGPIDVEVGGVAADSLGARRCGELVYDICRMAVDDVILVEDEEIRDAQRRLWREAQIVAEPGGAAALAALTGGRYTPQRGERVGILVCGGNADLTALVPPRLATLA